MHWTRALALSAAVGMLALAGCGSDDDDPSTPAAATGSPAGQKSANAATGDPIVIGNIGSYSGVLGKTLGKGDDVLEAWAEDKNANGGINGHPVKVVTRDDASNPAKALAGVKELVEEEDVVAIVANFSFQSAAWAKYASDAGVPVVGGAATEPTFMTDPNFFASGATLVPMLYGQLELAKENGRKKLGVMACAETPACAQLIGLLTAMGPIAGVEVVGQKVSSTAANFTAPCLKLKDEGADALFAAVTSDLVPRVTEACAKQGYEPLSDASDSTVDGQFLEHDVMDGTVFSSTNALNTQESIPGIKRFNAVVDERLPGLRDTPAFTLPLTFAWAGGELFAAAAEAADLTPDSEPADVKRGLYALENETLDGVAPPLNFTEGQPGISPCYFSSKIEDGAFVSPNGGKPICLDEATAGKVFAAAAG